LPPPRADYHLHSQFSCDAKNTMEEMCRAAIEAGLEEIVVTDHLDLHPLDECPGFYRPDAYFDELARCQAQFDGQLRIKAGVEVGDAHRFAAGVAEVVRGRPYDFAVGSVHWIGDEAPFGREFFVSHDGPWAYAGYFRELARMAHSDDWDVVGHLDLIKREGTEYYGKFDADTYREELRAILRTLVERGKGIEINTSGWRRSAGEPCPGLPVLRWYAELGGEILTIGSDAHRTPHVGLFWDKAVALAREAGLRWLTTFDGRKPTQHRLE
jgi:histidinol-phosphatase (PHP family)